MITAVSGIELGDEVSIIRLKHQLGKMPQFNGKTQSHMTPVGINSHLLGQLKFGLNACAQAHTDTSTSDTGAKPQAW